MPCAHLEEWGQEGTERTLCTGGRDLEGGVHLTAVRGRK